MLHRLATAWRKKLFLARPAWVDRKCIKTGEDNSKCGPKWTSGQRKHRGSRNNGEVQSWSKKQGRTWILQRGWSWQLLTLIFKRKTNTGWCIKMAEKISK